MHSYISEVYERLWGAGCNAARFWSERPGMQPASQRRAQTARVGSRPKWVQMNFLQILQEMNEFNCCEFDIGDIVRSGFVRNYLIQKTKLGIGIE